MNITYDGVSLEMPERATAAQCLTALSACPAGTMAALVDGVVTELINTLACPPAPTTAGC